MFNNYIFFFFDHGQATSIGSSLVSQPFLWCWDVLLHVKQWSIVFLSPKWSLYCCHLVDLINSNLCLAPKSDLIQLIWDHYRSCPETFVPHVYLVVTWKYTYIHICLYKVCLLIYSYIYLHVFGYSVVMDNFMPRHVFVVVWQRFNEPYRWIQCQLEDGT